MVNGYPTWKFRSNKIKKDKIEMLEIKQNKQMSKQGYDQKITSAITVLQNLQNNILNRFGLQFISFSILWLWKRYSLFLNEIDTTL